MEGWTEGKKECSTHTYISELKIASISDRLGISIDIVTHGSKRGSEMLFFAC